MKLANLEIIAIHIKKTGGMSFKELLIEQYGKNYFRINTPPKDSEVREEIVRNKIAQIRQNTRVIHGHFKFLDMKEIIKDNPQVQILTWLREPVQRVISQYYFLKRKYSEGKRKNIEHLGEFSLIEFANQECRKNLMARVLYGIDLEEMKFVGLLEHFEEDLDYVTNLFGWKPLPMPENNSNIEYRSNYPPPTVEEIEEIQSLNQDDIALYGQAQELRKKRIRMQ